MLTVEEIRHGLRDRRIARVSEETGISQLTLYRLRNGETNDPRISTVMTLSEYLTRVPGLQR
jgi:DNA-binding phage protein